MDCTSFIRGSEAEVQHLGVALFGDEGVGLPVDEDGENLSAGRASRQREHGIEVQDSWAQFGHNGPNRRTRIPVTH